MLTRIHIWWGMQFPNWSGVAPSTQCKQSSTRLYKAIMYNDYQYIWLTEYVPYLAMTVYRPIHSSAISLRSSGAYVTRLGRHWFRQWLLACSAPSPSLNQCWVMVIWIPKLMQENAFENVACKIADILSKLQRVKWPLLSDRGTHCYGTHAHCEAYWVPVYWRDLILIQACLSNATYYKRGDKNTYPFPICNGATLHKTSIP